ncbi:MAG: hypothetical protein F6K22_06795 [Okeania sp. SIO2F4]|uniref:pre-peptidase C-terminal domain-containing protein n=1 Tax=Okeania sp. SIO2F4 TaxID=2607790 RepID=UPI00142C7F5A|nr:pre-peptidase C-terminal domain-containing protein [Okeania sp. SIO2F4]NES02575.1 hypothetical protein [Okeania sp. SIO2F4]
MSGFRRVGNILFSDGTEQILIPSSEIESNQPLRVTVFPISSSPDESINLDAELILDGNAPDLPISSNFTGIGEAELIVYNPLVSNIDYTTLVTSVNGTTGFYLLEVSSEDSSNDFSNTAVSIGNVFDNPSVNGFVGNSDPDDWFNFQVSSNSQVRVTLDAIQDNAQLELYDRGLNLINSAQATLTNNGLITQNLATGNYLLRVTPADTSVSIPDGGQASTEYTLAVQEISGNSGSGNFGGGNFGGGNFGGGNFGGGNFGGSSQDVLRFWDFTSQSHIFTANQFEIDDLTGEPTFFRPEGNEFDVPVNEGAPVFRYLNTATGSDFLSFEVGIEDSLPQFINTGIAFNAYKPVGTTNARPADAPANAIPVYRLANLDAEQADPLNITHFYTSDPNNRQLVLDTLNYRDEFVGFWALPASANGLV